MAVEEVAASYLKMEDGVQGEIQVEPVVEEANPAEPTDAKRPRLHGDVDPDGSVSDNSFGDGKPSESKNKTEEEKNLFLDGTEEERVLVIWFEIPYDKVRFVLGEDGEYTDMINYYSGAEIRILWNVKSYLRTPITPVKIFGKLSSVMKAVKLICDSLAQADARDAEDIKELEMQVPKEKVGLIMGMCGIKSREARSGAYIQLFHQHPSECDGSKAWIVRLTGNRLQIEKAREIIFDLINQRSYDPEMGPPPPYEANFKYKLYGEQSAYDRAPQGHPPHSHGPPRANQLGEAPPYQGRPNVPSQQQYTYESTASTQQSYPPYGAYGKVAPSCYPQQSGQPFSTYGQPGGQQTAEGILAGSYGSCRQPAAANAIYGYQQDLAVQSGQPYVSSVPSQQQSTYASSASAQQPYPPYGSTGQAAPAGYPLQSGQSFSAYGQAAGYV